MKRNTNNKGQVLVLVALAMFVILGFAAVAIDAGYMYSVRHELQRCADTGALAGASAFTTGDWNEPAIKVDADARARDYAAKDAVSGEPLTQRIDNVVVDFPRPDHIRVTTIKTVPLFFARIFGVSNKTITAYAVAKAEITDLKTCMKPFAIPYPWLDDIAFGEGQGNEKGQPNGLYDTGEHVYTTCENPGTLTGLCVGNEYTIKVGNPSTDPSNPSGQQTAGHFFIAQGNLGPDGNPVPGQWIGPDVLPETIRDGCLWTDNNLRLNLMTGGKLGLTIAPIEDLIAKDPGKTWQEAVEVGSPRIISIAMYDPRVPMVLGGGASAASGTWASIQAGYSFQGFFVERVESGKGTIVGTFVPAPGNGLSSGTSPANPTGTEVKTVTLVE